MGVYRTGNVHIIWCCGQLAPSYILEVLLQCNIVRHKSQEITVGSYPDAFSIVQPPTLPMLMPGRPLFRAMAARQPLPRVAEVVDNGSNAANLRRRGLGAALYSTFSPGTASSVNNGQVRNAAAAGRGGVIRLANEAVTHVLKVALTAIRQPCVCLCPPTAAVPGTAYGSASGRSDLGCETWNLQTSSVDCTSCPHRC